MSYRRPVADADRPQLNDIAEEIGEDPAQFLDSDDDLLWARLKGIDRVDVARAWIEAEIEFGEYRGDSPRSKVIGALNQRIQELEETGEREDKLHHKRRRPEPLDRGHVCRRRWYRIHRRGMGGETPPAAGRGGGIGPGRGVKGARSWRNLPPSRSQSPARPCQVYSII